MLGCAILEGLYSKLDKGTLIELGDIEAALRMPAEFFNLSDSGIQIVRSSNNTISGINKIVTRRKTIVARSIGQKDYINGLKTSDITFGIGPAGTGKTYLAVAVAVPVLEGCVDKIILARPAVEAGERLGFLLEI